MNNKLAVALNEVLAYFLGLHTVTGRVSKDNALAACKIVAEAASKQLGGNGIDAAKVAKVWNKPRLVCIQCSKRIGRGHKWRHVPGGGVVHRNCQQPGSYNGHQPHTAKRVK